MAHLYFHRNRGHYLRYQIYFPDGKEQRKYRYYPSKRKASLDYPYVEALEAHSLKESLTTEELRFAVRKGFLTDAEAHALGGDLQPLVVPSWEELKEEFLKRSAERVREYMHYHNERRANNLVAYFEDFSVTEISETVVSDYMKERLKTVKAKTVREDLLTLAQMFDVAVEKGALAKNPARMVDRRMLSRDARERRPRSLTREEIDILTEAAWQDKRNFAGLAYPIIMTYLYTGMRRGEMVYQKTEDVDLKKRTITIQPAASGDFSTKSGKFRVVGVNKKLVDILEPFVKQKTLYLFGAEDQPLLLPNGHSQAFLSLRKAAKLPQDISLHSLRHTYITHLLDAGVPIRRVQYLAGHSDIKTTMKYAHVLPTDEIAEDRLAY